MINPANYYNPFAKYNYISKTRGAYVPQDAEIQSNLWKDSSSASIEKTSNIWSDNYDPQVEIDQSLQNERQESPSGGIFGIFNNFFHKE